MRTPRPTRTGRPRRTERAHSNRQDTGHRSDTRVPRTRSVAGRYRAPVFTLVRTGRARRGALIIGAGLAALAVLAGCGDNLAKANFARSTVTPAPGVGDGAVPTGPITDPAVAVPVLRTLDPCPLLDDDALGAMGTPGERRKDGYSGCSTEVKDPGGKAVNVSLKIGDSMLGSVEDASGDIEGLPLVENKIGDSCTTTAVTSAEPTFGIELRVSYPGGEPCRPARTALQKIVKALHANPAAQPAPPGSLITADPCEAMDPALVAELVPGAAKKSPGSIRDCRWSVRMANVSVGFRSGYAPSADSDGQEIDLGNGLKGFAERTTPTSGSCDVKWLHRADGDDKGEIVKAGYDNGGQGGPEDDVCGKATKLATQVAGKLPKA